ncbi:MAG: helix-turn-helix domain-containing protein [Candidatus Competibacter sp.]|nr:helix-turn-helix domain-containing protein [Candidatus Competibacter sp.]
MDVINAAAYLGLSPKSLACMRSQGRGPTFTKLGKPVFYTRDDLDAWIAANRATSTAEHKAKRKLP